MKFVLCWIRALAAVGLLVASAHFAPVNASGPADRGAFSIACNIAHYGDNIVPAHQVSVREFSFLGQESAPTCPTGCHSCPAPGCCGSVVLTSPSASFTVSSTVGDLTDEAEQSLSGVEPETLQEPPQLSA